MSVEHYGPDVAWMGNCATCGQYHHSGDECEIPHGRNPAVFDGPCDCDLCNKIRERNNTLAPRLYSPEIQLLEKAMILLDNVGEGSWESQTPKWQETAMGLKYAYTDLVKELLPRRNQGLPNA